MNPIFKPLAAFLVALLCVACSDSEPMEAIAPVADNLPPEERGPNNGFMLRDGDFSVELAIFETGVPPEYRAWGRVGDELLPPNALNLNVELTRLGGIVDSIGFSPQGDALRGDMTIYEPHSFSVSVNAAHNGRSYHWQYDSFEGRTMIEPAVREALGITTEVAGPAVIEESVPAFGKIVSNTENEVQVRARFEGQISNVYRSLGDKVNAGDRLAIVDSNQSLTPYTITAPSSGTIIERRAKAGEQTAGRELFTILDTSSVWVDLAIFPGDLARVAVGAPVRIFVPTSEEPINGSVAMFLPTATVNQSVTARVVLNNPDGLLIPGMWANAQIHVDEYEVPLAVKRIGLQSFRDFTVVYAQVGDEYEVRMLELGRQDDTWIEVLGGLPANTTYVTENSYILKADVEKSGASHDH